jgi:hypothetical protein
MHPEDEVPESVRSTLQAMQANKKEGYGLGGRIVLFVLVIGIGSALAFGIWIHFAMGRSMSAGGGGGGSLFGLVPFVWILGVVTATFLIFKK